MSLLKACAGGNHATGKCGDWARLLAGRSEKMAFQRGITVFGSRPLIVVALMRNPSELGHYRYRGQASDDSVVQQRTSLR
jgi:hypothetical protein